MRRPSNLHRDEDVGEVPFFVFFHFCQGFEFARRGKSAFHVCSFGHATDEDSFFRRGMTKPRNDSHTCRYCFACREFDVAPQSLDRLFTLEPPYSKRGFPIGDARCIVGHFFPRPRPTACSHDRHGCADGGHGPIQNTQSLSPAFVAVANISARPNTSTLTT